MWTPGALGVDAERVLPSAEREQYGIVADSISGAREAREPGDQPVFAAGHDRSCSGSSSAASRT